MIVNLIVGGVTLLMLLFVLVWIFFPTTRNWFERPKHRFMETEQLMDEKRKS